MRAALIGAALFFGVADGMPIPSKDAAEKLPAISRWASDIVRPVRDAILAPVRFIGDGLGVRQRWELFTGSRPERFRLWIEARSDPGEPWQVLFRAQDPEHELFADELEYRRVRGIWNPSRRGPRAGYPVFVGWVARRIFLSDERWDAVRVGVEQIRILPRGQGYTGTGTFEHVEVRRRAEVLP